MRQVRSIVVILGVFLSSAVLVAQTAQAPSVSVPRLITISGVFRPADGRPASPVETVTLSIYADQQGGTALWQETQNIAVDAQGRYSLLLGATHADGIPAAVFGGDEAHWLGTVFERAGEIEGPRQRLTSVPYAFRAADADTLGGRPASAYVLAPDAGGAPGSAAGGSEAQATSDAGGGTADVVLPGTANYLAKYVNGADVGSSGVFEAADGAIGMGTTTPFDRLHIRYNNNTGDFTGLAVQNTNPGVLAYSGMLFYDHNNALTQFQGYNNATHEYRINNIARVSPGGAFNGSINFMLGGLSKFLVAPNGNIGIGTTSPAALLEVSNALTGAPSNVWTTSYTNFVGPYYLARRARGTAGAPTAAQNGDGLSGLYGMGYGTTQFGPASTGGITIEAAQNFTDTQQGTAIKFSTTAINSATPTTRMTLDASGNLGIGTATVPAAGILEVSNATSALPTVNITGSSFTGANTGGTLFIGRKARGTSVAPTAVQNGDLLVGFQGQGYGATGFSGIRGGMFVQAAENWTNTAQGTRLNLTTTMTGTIASFPRVTISPAGDVGIGTTNPQAAVEVVREGETTIHGISYNNDDGSAVFFQRARGTFGAPTAVQAGDVMGYFGAGGYGETGFGDGAGAIAIVAAENWTDSANGTTIGFISTPLGTTDVVPRMVILPNGFVGIGTPEDANGIPTAADRLQAFGDIRVGTSGTNGCVRRFDGTGIAGTCSSDRRLKRNITPFAPMLDKVTALQPVNYFWRASEFPERHFGNSQSYGLIAQDVEQVLPELVETDSDGYKAVDYSKLPLLTIEAMKELKVENDARKAENDALKQRLSELEHLVNGLLDAAGRR